VSAPGHRLSPEELAALAVWLSEAGVTLAGPLQARLIAGGRSNLTYELSDSASRWVLRTPPRVGRTPSAHDVVREYRVVAALTPTDVPVAPAVAVCEDPSVLGIPFALTGFVPGATIRTQAELGSLDDSTVDSVTLRLVETLAALHRVDHVAVGLADFGRPDGYAERQVRRWSRQWEIVGAPELGPLAAEVSTRLAAALPAQASTGIVHGDYRIDNTILRLGPAAAVAAVVDWELSTIGDPVADVAMMCAYRHPLLDLILGGPSAWTSPRLRSPADLAAAYESAGGVPLAAWEFHLALAYFKIGVIAAGIDHRVRAGAASGPGFDTAGQTVAGYLELSLDQLTGGA
jgi:aminoglycoside phosphotransferase (APT) family kinase protein